jgi:hypothetical protein
MLSWGCDEENFVVSKHCYNMILKLSLWLWKTYCSAFVAKLHFYISLNFWAGWVICLQFWTEYFVWFVGTFYIDLLQHFVLICCSISFWSLYLVFCVVVLLFISLVLDQIPMHSFSLKKINLDWWIMGDWWNFRKMNRTTTPRLGFLLWYYNLPSALRLP